MTKSRRFSIETLLVALCTTFLGGSVSAEETGILTTELGEIAIYPEKEALASVVTLNDSQLSSEISGRILKVHVEVGETVNAGDLVVQLDATDYRLVLEQARANIESAQASYILAEKQLDRANQLVEQGFISSEGLNLRENDFTKAKAALSRHRAQFEIAKRNVEKCSIKSPFNSIVRERMGKVGEITNPGVPILRLIDTDSVEINAKLRPDDILSLQSSRDINFFSYDRLFPVSIKRVAPYINETDRFQTVRFEFHQEKAKVGSAGFITWKSRMPHVPVDVIVQRQGKFGIFLYEEGQAVFLELATATGGNPAKTSLPLNTQIITKGHQRLQPGQDVHLSK